MAEVKKFCTNCGKPLEPGTRFCGFCGKEISGSPPAASVSTGSGTITAPPTLPAPPAKAPPAATAEQLIGVIPGISRKKGLFAVEGFSLVVTEKRLIFAVVTSEMVKEAAKKANEEAKANGKGFMAGMLEAATVGYTIHKRYFDMTPEAALAENSTNFAVELSRVKKVKIEPSKRVVRHNSNRRQETWEDGRLEIQTAGEKYFFSLPQTSYEAAREVIGKAGL